MGSRSRSSTLVGVSPQQFRSAAHTVVPRHGSIRRPERMKTLFVALAIVVAVTVRAAPAQAATCGPSGSHQICITLASRTLSGEARITITNSPNTGALVVRWLPAGRSVIALQTEFGRDPVTNDYSFVWPTQKYLDASGVLMVSFGNTRNATVDVAVTLANGNIDDFTHAPNDWKTFLPGPWDAPIDPVFAAVGDGASGERVPAAVAASIAAADPAVFAYLGDVYESGTPTEMRNHYGLSSMDAPRGTLWGALANITQPVIGTTRSRAWRRSRTTGTVDRRTRATSSVVRCS